MTSTAHLTWPGFGQPLIFSQHAATGDFSPNSDTSWEAAHPHRSNSFLKQRRTTVVGVVFGLFHTAWATQFVWSEHSEEVFVLTWFTFRSFAAPFQSRLINSLADPFPWMGCEGSACSMLLGLAMMALTQGPGASLENNRPKKVRVCYLSFDKLYSSECVLIIFSNWLWVSNWAFVTEGTFSPLFLVLLEQGFGAVRCFCCFHAFWVFAGYWYH